MTSRTRQTTRAHRIMILRGVWVLFALLSHPLTVGAQSVSAAGSFTDAGFSTGGGLMLDAGGRGATMGGDFFVHLNVININSYRYTGFGVEASYTGDPGLDFFSVMGRLEFGLKKGSFGGSRIVGFNTPYLALMAGFGSGTVWDETYVDLYDMVDEVEVAVTGIPMYASLGWRRVGRIGINLEALAGLTIITSQEADLPEGTAPSIIPGIGFRVGFGFDTFSYSR